MRIITTVGALAVFMTGTVSFSYAGILIDNTTLGYYNDSIGTSLNGTNLYGDPLKNEYLFPTNYNTEPKGDPTLLPVPFDPDLSAAASALGDWLNPASGLIDTDPNWAISAIPNTWTVNDETAIVYELDAGTTGLANVEARFGVDNGLFVWLDGSFLSGWLRPGGATLGEHSYTIGTLSAGTHYLQILREDHGGSTGYGIEVSGTTPVPEPTTMLLLGTGLAGLAGFGRRRRK